MNALARLLRGASCGLVVMVGLTTVADGAILFSYEDPDALVREFMYTQPAMVGQTGSLAFDSSIDLRLTIDASEEQAGARTTVDARLTYFDMSVGPVTLVNNAFVAEALGRFEFRLSPISALSRGDDSDLIFSGEFTDSALFTLFGSGTFAGAMNQDGGSLVLTAGAALFDILLANTGYMLPGGGFDPNGPASVSWSLAEINESITAQTLVNFGGGEQFFPNFAAENAFVGRATVIPAPAGAILLGALGWPVLSRRRRA